MAAHDRAAPATHLAATSVSIASLVAPTLVGVGILALAFDGGGFDAVSRGTAAIALLWAIALGVLTRIWPVGDVPHPARLTAALLAAFALLAGLSSQWGESAERAMGEANRVVLYVAVLAIVALAIRPASVTLVADAVGVAIVVVVVVALASRLVTTVIGPSDLAATTAGPRLSYPVNYWNGLAILAALGVPLLLRIATDRHRALLIRAGAVGFLPAIAAVAYLASSRGGAATAVAAVVAFLLLAQRRWSVVAAAGAGAAGSAAILLVLVESPDVVNRPTLVGGGESTVVFAALVLACLLSAGLHAVGVLLSSRLRYPKRRTSAAAVALAVALTAAGIALADPAAQVRAFTSPPVAYDEPDYIRAHFFAVNSSGRWETWAAAVDQFRERPLVGMGAGSFQAWWAERRTIDLFVQDAHSLYLETLGELGAVGLALLAAALAVPLVCGLRRRRGDETQVVAAATAGFAAFMLSAAIEWMWELTVVSVVGMVFAGLLVGPISSRGSAARRAVGARLAVATVALGLAVLQAAPLLSELLIRRSQTALAAGELTRALDDTRDARRLEPWASSPYVQLALVHEVRGDLDAGREAISRALVRDRDDWRIWLVSARLAAKDGDGLAARRDLARAVRLNPRSPLFADFRDRAD